MEDLTNTISKKKRKSVEKDLEVLDVAPSTFLFNLGISSHNKENIVKHISPVKVELECPPLPKVISVSGEPCPDDVEELELRHQQDLELLHHDLLLQQEQQMFGAETLCVPESEDDEAAIDSWCNLSYDVYLTQSQKVEIKVEEEELPFENNEHDTDAVMVTSLEESLVAEPSVAVTESSLLKDGAPIGVVRGSTCVEEVKDRQEDDEEEDLDDQEVEDEDPRDVDANDDNDEDDSGNFALQMPDYPENEPDDLAPAPDNNGSSGAPGNNDSSGGNRFLNLDDREVKNAADGGERGSKNSDRWASNAFDEWRLHKGYGTKLTIGELSEQEDIRGFVDMLHDFALQVTKKDGTLYPPQSIQNMVRALGRVIRLQQERRILRTSITELPFDIFRDVRYRKVKMAANEAVKRSFRRGLGTRVSTSDCLSMEEEVKVLSCPAASLCTPTGCNFILLYLFLRNFFIRGQEEVRATNVNQFELVHDGSNEVLRYKPTLSKNYKFTVDRCAAHSLRKPLDCGDPLLVRAWKSMTSHRPPLKVLTEKFGDVSPPVFLVPKQKIKKADVVWYQPRAVGKNTLSHMVKDLVEASGIDIAGRKITNKTPRRMGITRMEEAHIPVEKGMAVTGHRDVKSYKQYNSRTEKTDMTACQRIISGISTVTDTGETLKFEEVLKQEEQKVQFEKAKDYKAAINLRHEEKIVVDSVGTLPLKISKDCSRAIGTSEEMPADSGFVFRSVSGCNFFNFSGTLEASVVSSLMAHMKGNVRDVKEGDHI